MSPPRVLRCPPSPLQTVSTAKRGLCCRTSNAFDSRDLSARVRLTHRRIPMGHTWRLDNVVGALAEENQAQQESHQVKEELSPSNDFGKYLGKKALVIGAGPGGLVSALYLAREGFTVEVFEKRGDPRENPYPLTRSNIIGLRGKTLKAIRDVGVEVPEEGFRSGVHLGSLVFGPEKVESFPFSSSDKSYMGERQSYMQLILAEAQDKHVDQITFHYQHACKGIDLEAKKVVFEDLHGKESTQSYDLLIGADGYNSVVRQELQKLDDSIVTKCFRCKWGFKSIRRLSLLDGDAVSESVKPGYILFGSLNGKSSVTRGLNGIPTMMFYRSASTMVNGTLGSTVELLEAIEGREYEWLKDATPSYFPEKWIKEISDQLKTAPITRYPDVISLSRMYGPSTVLIGDAAHSFSPILGIGANSAIGDAKVLGDALHVADGDIEAAAKTFHDLRFDEMRALQKATLAHSFQKYDYPSAGIAEFFVGWVHQNVTVKLRRMFPKLLSTPFEFAYVRGEISAVQALFIVRRNACLFALACLVAMFLVAKFMAIPLASLIVEHLEYANQSHLASA